MIPAEAGEKEVVMPLDLHEDCKEQLVEKLAKGLPTIKVKNGNSLEQFSCYLSLHQVEKVIPEGLQIKLVDYINDYPITNFVSDTLTTELVELGEYLADTPPIDLTTIEGYENPNSVARSLVDRLESLPWDYTLSLKLPEDVSALLSTFITDYPLSPRIRLVNPGEDFEQHFPLHSEDEKRQKRIFPGGILSLALGPDEWDSTAIYLQIETEGFIGPYGGSIPYMDVERLVKAVCGLGIALWLFHVEYTYSPAAPKFHFFVHKKVDQNWVIDNRIDLGDEKNRALNYLKMLTLSGKLDTEAKKVAWARVKLDEMRATFSSEEKAENIILASQWLFDSYTSRDQLLSYIQAMVVLEILLGDKALSDEIGLGQLLSNRCAYLIGDSRAQRSKLLRDFDEIYDVRSKILHRGKHRLSLKESGLLNRLKWMCGRVIQEEVKLLKKDQDAKNPN